MRHSRSHIAGCFALFATCIGFALSCRSATDAEPARTSFDVVLTTDSALVYASGCGSLYCFAKVASTGTMSAHLTFGPRTDDLSPPTDGLAKIVSAYSDVRFADSLIGKAVVDTAGLVTVFVGAQADATGFVPTDYFTLQGRISGDRFSGRWRQQIDPHGLAKYGSFVSVASPKD